MYYFKPIDRNELARRNNNLARGGWEELDSPPDPWNTVWFKINRKKNRVIIWYDSAVIDSITDRIISIPFSFEILKILDNNQLDYQIRCAEYLAADRGEKIHIVRKGYKIQ